MRAGRLRHRVTLQRAVVTRDETGGEVKVWEDVGTYWGSVEPLRGQELFAAAQVQVKYTTTIVLRYSGIPTTLMRAAFKGRLFAIETVINRDERMREYQLLCTEREADGWRD